VISTTSMHVLSCDHPRCSSSTAIANASDIRPVGDGRLHDAGTEHEYLGWTLHGWGSWSRTDRCDSYCPAHRNSIYLLVARAFYVCDEKRMDTIRRILIDRGVDL